MQSFVYGNNLYLQSSPYDAPTQITFSGHELYVFNGVPDWLYEGPQRSCRFVARSDAASSSAIIYVKINSKFTLFTNWLFTDNNTLNADKIKLQKNRARAN